MSTSADTPESPRWKDWLARIAGCTLLACFFGLSTAQGGFLIQFKAPFTRISQGEANLWLGMAFLLTPAGVLVGWGFREQLKRVCTWAASRIGGTTPRERFVTLVLLGVVAVIVARLGNELVLEGFPVTDEEWAARFGGQLLARGRLFVAPPFTLDAIPKLFLYMRDGAVTSTDWLGTQLAWAIDDATGTDHLIFAISAALPVPCVAYLVSRRLSPAWGYVAAAITLISPMGFALSMSTHGHLHSRGLIALTLALHAWASDGWNTRRAAYAGGALGASIICRPFETVAMLAPYVVLEIRDALRAGGARRRCLSGTAIAALVPVFAFMAHSHAVTGGWLPPRFGPGFQAPLIPDVDLWTRFGSNVGFNLMRLGVWFAGPIGVALVALGAARDRFTLTLGAGIVSLLLVGLGHQDFGIHALGPIHQSDCLVPLSILATLGLARVSDYAARWNLDRRMTTGAALAALLVSCGLFSAVHAAGLHEQASIQRKIYGAIDAGIPASSRPAIVLAPHFYQIWARDPAFAPVGTWVFEWRRPSPAFDEPVSILHDGPGVLASVRAAFPQRTVLRVGRDEAGQFGLAPADSLPEPTTTDATPAASASVRAAAPRGPQLSSTASKPSSQAVEALAVETFTEARAALLECLREERQTRDGVAGKLPVAVRVDGRGFVADVRLGDSPVRSPGFDECAETSIAMLVFPDTLAMRELSITYDLR